MKPQAWFIWLAKVRTHQTGAIRWPLRLRLTEDLVLCGFLCSRGGRNSNSLPGRIQHSEYVAELLVELFLSGKGPQQTNKEWCIVHCVSQSFFCVSHFPWHKSSSNRKMPFCINPVNNMRTSGAKSTVNPIVLGTHCDNSLQPSY